MFTFRPKWYKIIQTGVIHIKNLTSPTVLKQLLSENSFRFTKSLGQNFLIDENVLDIIIQGACINTNSCVLEIGPGFGTLTQRLCMNAKKVAAVEIDQSVIPILKENLSGFDNINIINSDILKTDISALIEREFGSSEVKVCANLPYYITSPVITRLLKSKLPVTDITVMIQKEVARRIAATPGTKSYGVLSVTAAYYAEAEILADVPPSSFMPQPKVFSSVIKLNLRSSPPVEVKSEDTFFKAVGASFAQRRKTILNALSGCGIFGISKEEAADILKSAGIDPQRRGETLTLEEFASLADMLYNKTI